MDENEIPDGFKTASAKVINVAAMDTANYTKLINAAMASIDEKYDFESVGKYTVSTLHGDAEPIVDFEVNVTEHGNAPIRSVIW